MEYPSQVKVKKVRKCIKKDAPWEGLRYGAGKDAGAAGDL